MDNIIINADPSNLAADKTDLIIIDTKHIISTQDNKNINRCLVPLFTSSDNWPLDNVRNMGIIFDSDHTFYQQIGNGYVCIEFRTFHLKLKFRKYPSIHTNYIISHSTILQYIIIIFDTVVTQKRNI